MAKSSFLKFKTKLYLASFSHLKPLQKEFVGLSLFVTFEAVKIFPFRNSYEVHEKKRMQEVKKIVIRILTCFLKRGSKCLVLFSKYYWTAYVSSLTVLHKQIWVERGLECQF